MVFAPGKSLILRLTLRLSVAVLLISAVGMNGRALADQNDPRLSGLFEKLAGTESFESAIQVEQSIWQIWSEWSEDQQVGILLQRGVMAMRHSNLEAALGLFDEVVLLAPGLAEGWNKRATVHYLMGSLAESVADIQRTLALEPRHFGALSGLGLIYMADEQPEAAARAFEAALKIHPHMPGPRHYLGEIRKALDGQKL